MAEGTAPEAVVPASSDANQPKPHFLDSIGLKSELRGELIYILRFSWPIVLNFVLGFCLALGSQIVVGRLGPVAFAAASLASMLVNALGYSIAMGSAAAVDILCSQAVGARNYARAGIVSQRGVLLMSLLSIPLVLIWVFGAGPLFTAFGLDEEVVKATTSYVRILAFGLWPTLIYEVGKRHLQSLGVTTPPMLVIAFAALENLVLAAILVQMFGLMGAPVATVLTQWSMLGMIAYYFKNHRSVNGTLSRWKRFLSRAPAPTTAQPQSQQVTSSLSEEASSKSIDLRPLGPPEETTAETPTSVDAVANPVVVQMSSEEEVEATASTVAATSTTAPDVNADGVLITDQDELIDASLSAGISWADASDWKGIKEYLGLGIPSALLLISEWSSYESSTIVAGMIGVITIAAQSVMMSTASLVFMAPLGFSIAASIRIGQRMGENNPEKAKLAYRTGLVATAGWGLLNGIFILVVAEAWPYLYTDDDQVAELVTHSLWMLAIYCFFDFVQCCTGSSLRAVGRPGLGAATNVLSWLVIGVPGAYLLGFKAELGLRGIWLAFILAVFCACITMGCALACINWSKEAEVAHERAKKGMGTGGGGH